MANFFKSTTKQILFLSLVLAVINFILWLINPDIAPSLNYVTIVLFLILTNGVIFLITKGKNTQSPQTLMNIFLGSSIAKMFILLIYIFILVFTKNHNIKTLLIYLLIYFVFYLIFEVVILLKKIKKS